MPTTTLGRNATGLRGVNNLTVRIGRGVAARSVCVPLPGDAEITWTAPGGDDTFTCTVPWPDRGMARPDAFTQNMPVRVEDRRTGEVIWQGRVADPGFSGDRTEQGFRISAVGSAHDLDMISVVKMYIDRDPDSWHDSHIWQAGGPLNAGDGSGFVASFYDALGVLPGYYLEFSWPQGTTMNLGAIQKIVNLPGLYAAQDMDVADGVSTSNGPTGRVPEVHGLRFSWISLFASNNQVKIYGGSPDVGSPVLLLTQGWTAGDQHDVDIRKAVQAAWTRDDFTYFSIQGERSGAATAAASDGYLRIANIQVIGKRYNRYGVNVTDARNEMLAPYEVFEDMLGTILNGRFDPGTITADGSIYIDQATWRQPTPVSEILDAANEWNNDAWWGVWAPANPDALPRLDYRSWLTTPRYTLDDTATVDLVGGAEQWANSALVAYLRGNGVQTVTRATIPVPAVARIFGTTGTGTAATKTRDLSLDLTGQGPMTRASAVQLATQMLAAAATERASGSAVVRSPIIDDATGRLVQPWEIRPGWPILVGSTPNQFTAGRPVTFDGESSFRLTKVTYSAADDAASLEFDGGSRRLAKGGPGSTARRFPYVPYRKRHHNKKPRRTRR